MPTNGRDCVVAFTVYKQYYLPLCYMCNRRCEPGCTIISCSVLCIVWYCMLYQAGIKPDYISSYFLYVYIFVYIGITGRYEAGLYQHVLYQLVSSRAGMKPDSNILVTSRFV